MASELPSYEDFLEHLPLFDLASLPDDEACLICRERFKDLLDNPQPASDRETQTLLSQLPYSLPDESPYDYPVRLPCQQGHILGVACLRDWYGSGAQTQCLACTQPLFRPRIQPHNAVAREYRDKQKRITGLPLRQLLIDDRAWTADQRIKQEDPVSAASQLLVFMATIAIRLERPQLPDVAHQQLKLFVNRGDPVDFVQPITHIAEYNVLPPGDRHPMANLIGWSIPSYQQEIRELANSIPLDNCGRYPKFLHLLFSPLAAVMFETLVRCLWYLCPLDWVPEYLTNHLIVSVKTAWGKELQDHEPMLLLLELTVKAWVAQQRMFTQLEEERMNAGANRLAAEPENMDQWAVNQDMDLDEEHEDENAGGGGGGVGVIWRILNRVLG